jgi:hypothetical protein
MAGLLLWLLSSYKHRGPLSRRPAGPKDAIPQMALSWHITTESIRRIVTTPHDAGPLAVSCHHRLALLSLNAISAGLVRIVEWAPPPLLVDWGFGRDEKMSS